MKHLWLFICWARPIRNSNQKVLRSWKPNWLFSKRASSYSTRSSMLRSRTITKWSSNLSSLNRGATKKTRSSLKPTNSFVRTNTRSATLIRCSMPTRSRPRSCNSSEPSFLSWTNNRTRWRSRIKTTTATLAGTREMDLEAEFSEWTSVSASCWLFECNWLSKWWSYL